MYAWCAVAALRVSGMVSSAAARLGLQICAVLAFAFCVWTVVVSEPKLLIVSLGFLALTVPIWIGARWAERARNARAAPVS